MFQQLYRSLTKMKGWQIAAAIASGVLLTLAYPHADIGWLAYFALVPFLCTFPYVSTRAAFGCGFLFGLTYFGCLLYWIAVFSETKIGAFGVAAWLILSSRESLWIGLFAAGCNYLWSRTGWLGRTVGAASLWTACEWLRQLGALGFGWGDLAYSQWRNLPMIQIASVTGIWGISWLVVMVNTAIASGKTKVISAAGAVVVLVCLCGAFRMDRAHPKTPVAAASALQADLSEDVPWSGLRPRDSGDFYGTLNDFDRMAGEAKARGATVCVTAETSIPGYPNFDPELKGILRSMAIRHNISLIVGARDSDITSEEDTNSVFVFNPDGTMVGPYNKQQLVPFGEYVPGRKQFPLLNAFHVLDFDMHAGSAGQKPLSIRGRNRAGIAICYESTYPRFLRQQVADGATFDVVVTDDTWYGKTAAAKQHLAMSVLRAVETDRCLVRCASTGISAIISPIGKIEASADIFKRAVVTGPIDQRFDLTPFVRFGDWFAYVSLGTYLLLLFVNKKNKAQVE